MAWRMAPAPQVNQRTLHGRTPCELAHEFRRHAYELKLRGGALDVQGGAIVLPDPSGLSVWPQSAPSTTLRVIRVAMGSLQMALVALVAWLLLFNFSIVRGQSMRPGIRDGDRILIDRFSYMFGSIERGDIVVLSYPLDPSLDYIKRVIGVPGDEIQIRAGQVIVNGEVMKEPYVADIDRTSYFTTVVAEGHYFVLGDNRPHSSDSREFGQVPVELLKGKVEVRLWPLGRLGVLE